MLQCTCDKKEESHSRLLQCVAVCCSVLQCTCDKKEESRSRLLQCVAVCCSVLQCTCDKKEESHSRLHPRGDYPVTKPHGVF